MALPCAYVKYFPRIDSNQNNYGAYFLYDCEKVISNGDITVTVYHNVATYVLFKLPFISF